MNAAPSIHARCDHLWSRGVLYGAVVLVTIVALLSVYSVLIASTRPMESEDGLLPILVLFFWWAALFLPAHEVQISVAAGMICTQRKLLWGWRKKSIPYSADEVLCMRRPTRKLTMASLSNDGGTICLLQGGRPVPVFTNLRSSAECERVYLFLQQHLCCQSVPFKR